MVDLERCEWTGFMGANGGILFLPAAGYRWDVELVLEGARGHYWSSSLYESRPDVAYGLYFDSGDAYWNYYDYRLSGFSVRPVRKK